MRPVGTDRSFLKYPLNTVFGTETQVRILRVMAVEVTEPISIADAARRAGITAPGARKAMQKLAASGFVTCIGAGRRKLYRLTEKNILIQEIRSLFHAEAERYRSLIISIRKKAQEVRPVLISAWINELPNECSEPVAISVLQDSESVDLTVSELEKSLVDVEREFDVTIELTGFTRADQPEVGTDPILIFGLPPDSIFNSSGITSIRRKSHRAVDERLSRMCGILTDMIMEDGSILERAKRYTAGMLKRKSDPASGDMEEWSHILNQYSIRRLVSFLESDTERALRLRQSCPLFAVLNRSERERLLNELESGQ